MPRRAVPDPATLKIGARIRQLRHERNMSMTELSDASGLAKGHISGIELGFSSMTVSTMVKLAQGLDLPTMYVLVDPAYDARDHIMELIRRLPAPELIKLRRALTKTVNDIAKAANKAMRPIRSRPLTPKSS